MTLSFDLDVLLNSCMADDPVHAAKNSPTGQVISESDFRNDDGF